VCVLQDGLYVPAASQPQGLAPLGLSVAGVGGPEPGPPDPQISRSQPRALETSEDGALVEAASWGEVGCSYFREKAARK
jgi:hypothetical protein